MRIGNAAAAVDQLLADEQVASLAAAGETLWALTDHLGTVRDLADNNGVLRKHLYYDDAFGRLAGADYYDESGELIEGMEPASNPEAVGADQTFYFTGRYFDRETGLQNNLHRWYDASTGRWISEDPIGFAAGDANLTRYVGNEPVGYIDPLGLVPVASTLSGYGGKNDESWYDRLQKLLSAGWAGITSGGRSGIDSIGEAGWWPFRVTGVTSHLGIEDDLRSADEAAQRRRDKIAHRDDDSGQALLKAGRVAGAVGVGATAAAAVGVGGTILSGAAATGAGASNLGIGTIAITPAHLPLPGTYAGLLIDGTVYAARMHEVAAGLAGGAAACGDKVQKYGIVTIDAAGKVIEWLGK